MPDFVHLHTHSDYSLLDGAAKIQNLIDKAIRLKMPALALTDHGNMFGVMKFYKEAKERGIKPLIGSEFYVAPDSRHKKGGTERLQKNTHMGFIARDVRGYRNLIQLSSRSFLEGFYYKPRIDTELIEKYHEGLIGFSGCLAGEIPRLILSDSMDRAIERAAYFDELLGRGNFYLELQYHGIEDQVKVNRGLLEIAKKTGIPVVATNDVHYLEREDARAQDILICIGTNKKVSEGKRLKFEYPEFYFKTQDEMLEIFKDVPDALKNTVEVAEMCELEIPLPGPQLPEYQVPEGYSKEAFLKEIARKGLKERYPIVTKEMRERLEYELSVIINMGFTGYFLIVWDFISFAKKNEIPVGPGRGSGAGSLVAYALKITDIDPLKYGLLFERFLNPERVTMPDFDIDFCYERRGEVIDYVTKKYGNDRVSQIITFGTLKPKAAVRDVARVLDFPYSEADAIAKMIPSGPKVTFEDALKLEPKLQEMEKKGEKYRELLEISKKLEGLSRHASTHAAGIVIGREPLTNYVPLFREAKTETVMTQYSMEYLEESGLVKMDFLGLKTLTVIKKTLEQLKKRGVELDINSIPENDKKTFDLLGKGNSSCVFQFEGAGMQGVLKRAKPTKIEELIALNALYRPGPMQFIDQFIDSKLGKKKIEYPLPDLEPILKETYGVIVYQEQVMEIARKIAGFSLGQADILRRAMGKKKDRLMAKQKIKFIEGAVSNGYTKKQAEKIFELLKPFAGYGFNKSHATAYSVIAYQTAYLKANYPAEFMAANLTNNIHDTAKLSEYIREARDMGLEILPPDINLSEKDFSVHEGKIIYGLSGIKNVGSAAVEEILGKRKEVGNFKSLIHFLESVDLKVVNRKVVETLIFSGVFDSLGDNRATLFHNLDRIMDIVSSRKESKRYGQVSLFEQGDPGDDVSGFEELERVEEWPPIDRLIYEKENLGFFFSGHPLDNYRAIINEFVNINLAEIENVRIDKVYTVLGILKDIKEITTRTGRRMAFAKIEDLRGNVELVIFSDVYEKSRELLFDDSIVAVRGRIDKSRGDIKIIAEAVMEPEALKERGTHSIHVRLSKNINNDEEKLLNMRDFLVEKKGRYPLYIHVGDVVIKASAQLSISDSKDVVENLKSYSVVEEVWKE